MPDAWLVYNCGAQEPRLQIDGRHVLPTQASALKVLGVRVEFKGTFDAVTALEKRTNPPHVGFPILEPALAYVERHQQKLKGIILIATESPDRKSFEKDPEDPRHNDSHPTARLMKKWLETRPDPPLIDIQVINISDPHLYDNSRRWLPKANILVKHGIVKNDTVFVCTSPGLPMVNMAVVQYVLREHGGVTHLFQIPEPSRQCLESGQWMEFHSEPGRMAASVPEADVASDFLLQSAQRLLDRYDYRAVLELIERVPETPRWKREPARSLLAQARDQWDLHPRDFLEDWRLKWFDRGRIALWKAAALGKIGDFNEQVSYLGDMTDYLEELAFVLVKQSEETLLSSKKPKKWRDELATCEYGPIVHKEGTRGKVVEAILDEARNRYVHSFMKPCVVPADIEQAAQCLEGMFSDLVARVGRDWTPPASFDKWNEQIKEALVKGD